MIYHLDNYEICYDFRLINPKNDNAPLNEKTKNIQPENVIKNITRSMEGMILY